jgi:hypothetical protein
MQHIATSVYTRVGLVADIDAGMMVCHCSGMLCRGFCSALQHAAELDSLKARVDETANEVIFNSQVC